MAIKPPRWYFSLRSPYSWLAFRDLTERYPDVADAIEWRPYWEPDEVSNRMLAEEGVQLPYVPMSKEKHFYILQDVKRLSTERGLTVAWPIDKDPNWAVSHLGYLVAQDEGRGRDYIGAVSKARWEHGHDIADRKVIAGVAEELGLDPDRVANAVDDEKLRARGLDILREMERDGVFGVPFFIHRRDKFWGIDRLPAFVETVRAARAVGATTSTTRTEGTES
ncbi:2-hydroxychromene-2-carboxylate isomerase [Streptomyces netropsis]|uniref:2-hydroxychromene-2-carboxylate isomerase n=1 Tax=Streptomyces netropsis TaxID=55404 RepID=A0A7W7LI62_STRNE|nr:DsbA family protein [Streptomyces netropsis]MBB4890071.1 2-hydroxychromene-2-carboxylate isomerase [Streptomyces netropsis]GGR42222.1 2-hydroxychromene-2-carboxylate isomerase [Streptomyces netropsis]